MRPAQDLTVSLSAGGTAACIVAGRLAEADPALSILVIERGQDNYNVATVTNPALFLSHLAPTSKTAIFYKANKASQLADRDPIVPSGGTLGGGSSINFMMYTRAQRSDYDSWKTPGWSANELLPYLKKVGQLIVPVRRLGWRLIFSSSKHTTEMIRTTSMVAMGQSTYQTEHTVLLAPRATSFMQLVK